jgi:hypothetical protein
LKVRMGMWFAGDSQLVRTSEKSSVERNGILLMIGRIIKWNSDSELCTKCFAGSLEWCDLGQISTENHQDPKLSYIINQGSPCRLATLNPLWPAITTFRRLYRD